MNYLEFDIDLRVHDALHYQVTARAAVGETGAVVAFPLTDAQLENHLLRLENAILRAGVDGAFPKVRKSVLQAFGRQLFDFLLSGDARLYWRALRGKLPVNSRGCACARTSTSALALLPGNSL
ncbi:MAG: hypothetical protein R2867_40550 [Caldilineaceae bacterium]